MTRKRLLIAAPLALVALLAVLALVGGLAGTQRAGQTAETTAPGSLGDSAAGAQRDGFDAAGVKAPAADQAANGGASYAALPPASSATHYLVRTGDLQVMVARHGLQSALQRITSVTTSMGGYVLSSYVGTGTPPWIAYTEPLSGVDAAPPEELPAQSGTVVSPGAPADTPGTDGRLAGSDGMPYGQVTVRVPSARFDAAVARFGALGRVEEASTSSTDVSDQVVDLRARLRHARSVERRLLSFLDQAKTVQAALAVQDRLDQNELTIEQLEGQIAQLSETTSYGTLTVSLRERGVPQPGAIDKSDSFAGAFVHSLHLIADGARVTAVALGALLPFAALAGALALAAWYVRRWIARRRPPRPQTIES